MKYIIKQNLLSTSFLSLIFIKMKPLQYNITSLNTSVEELWLYQQESNYDAIFRQETDYIEGKPLGHFKHWKNRMLTNCKKKIQGFGVRTLVSEHQKNVFCDDLSGPDLELVSNEMQIQGTETLVGNIYTYPR